MTGITVNAVNESGAEITTIIGPVDKGPKITYYINVIAIGLAQTLQV